MKGLIKSFDNLPWIVKLLLCLPIVDIVWAIYRIVKGAVTGNVLTLIAGIIWIVLGSTILWLIDLICIIATGHIRLFA